MADRDRLLPWRVSNPTETLRYLCSGGSHRTSSSGMKLHRTVCQFILHSGPADPKGVTVHNVFPPASTCQSQRVPANQLCQVIIRPTCVFRIPFAALGLKVLSTCSTVKCICTHACAARGINLVSSWHI